MSQNIYDVYRSYVDTYRQEYGDQTIVFIQVGSFYEIYDDGSNYVDIKTISELLNILVSKRNKNIPEVSRNNVLMAGIPIWAKQKYFNILVSQNYTLVIVEQVTDPPNPVRKVTEILSPGVPLESQTTNTFHPSNFLATIYIEEDTFLTIGFSAIDVFTGKSFVFECSSSKTVDASFCYDELYRLVSTYSPKEMVIFGSHVKKSFKEIQDFLDLGGCKFHNKLNTFDESLLKLSYMSQLLKKVYPNTGMLSSIEYLDLEKKPSALAAFVYLINFTYSHNDSILNRLQKPIHLETTGRLNLSYNCAKKLDILQPGYGLLSLLNTCATSMGKRLFREKLLNPLTDVACLQKAYDAIEELLMNNSYDEKISHLKEIYDLEQIYRRICNLKLHPYEWINIDTSIKHTLKLSPPDLTPELIKFQEYYRSVINLSMAEKYTLDTIQQSPFAKGYNEEIDRLQEQLEGHVAYFEDLVRELNKPNEFFKLETNERDGYFITITSKRYTEFKKSEHAKGFKIIAEIIAKPISSTSSTLKLYHPSFDQANKDITHIRQSLRCRVLSAYQVFLQNIAMSYENIFHKLVEFISETDVLVTHAKNAVKFGYSKPELAPTISNSFVEITSIRHPLIERLIDTPYVTNDISLGLEKDGMLLYGTNATGKSSLGKSVALAIIMAQSGMYVPAAHMKFAPYKRMFARIPTGDDLQKGHSTFVVEMLELRNILRFADAHSFCISDELCNGTESISGVGIVAAVIETLCSKRCSFITASHLHEIVELPEITCIQNLRICHLEVRYDETLQALVYDRKLKEGSGSSIYGLEVCRSLSLPDAFLDRANQFRKGILKISDKVINNRRSKYNSDIYFDRCEICGEKSDEIHHIKEQHTADKNGMIGSLHKNDISNLMNVCESCHDKIHSGDIKVEGFVNTSEGRKLLVKKGDSQNDPSLKTKIQHLVEDKKTIKQIQEEFPELTKYRIQKIIKEIKSNVF